MPNSLQTGVSGLIAHQRMLNVVGNNIANLNTIGYKVSRMRFADLLYETIRPAASGSANASIGGTNPNQLGSGVRVGQIDRRFGQGSLELTGGVFDFALQGQGFFVANDGTRNIYSRAGAFALDKSQTLVDPSTGASLVRFGSLGEGDAANPAFQTPGDARIQIPFGTILPGQATSVVNVGGNLSASSDEPTATKLIATTAFTLRSDGSTATPTTLLNDLDLSTAPFVDGTPIEITGRTAAGADVNTEFNMDSTTTVADLLTEINNALPGATAQLDGDGQLILEADETGPAPLELQLNFPSSTLGSPSIATIETNMIVEGTDPSIVKKELDIVDTLGRLHRIELTFLRSMQDNRWDLSIEMDPSEGTVVDRLVDDIRFDEQGLNPLVFGTDEGDSKLTFQFDGLLTPQTIDLDFRPSGSFGGLTQVESDSSIISRQDGFEPGTITGVSISQDGIIEGVATNGRVVPIAQLAIAFFENEKGLQSTGGNYFEESLNSGEAQLGVATSGGRGSVVGGQLESSNVDVAIEFTKLIIAQRGFSANARTITISNEVLEELTNIIR